MKRIIILSQAPLTPQIKSNSYVDEYLSVGFDVEFWDISQYMHPGIAYNDLLKEKYVKSIASLSMLEALLSTTDVSNAIFILDFSEFWSNRHIFKLLSKYRCYKVRIDMYANTSLKISKSEKIKKLFTNQSLRILKTKLGLLLYNFYKRANNISSFDGYYSSSSFVNRTNKINHPDYDNYMFSNKENVIGEPYIVFVDTYFGFHPDDIYIYKMKKNPIAVEYQKILCSYFLYLENKYKMPVVIAAHPKSNYNNGEFGGRKILKYKTMDLIEYADLVLLQLCNTISYVLLANKAVTFITTDEYDSLLIQKRGLRLLADLLGKKVYNLNKIEYSDIFFSPIDEYRRNEYIYSYLTDKSIEKEKNIDILKKSFLSIK